MIIISLRVTRHDLEHIISVCRERAKFEGRTHEKKTHKNFLSRFEAFLASVFSKIHVYTHTKREPDEWLLRTSETPRHYLAPNHTHTHTRAQTYLHTFAHLERDAEQWPSAYGARVGCRNHRGRLTLPLLQRLLTRPPPSSSSSATGNPGGHCTPLCSILVFFVPDPLPSRITKPTPKYVASLVSPFDDTCLLPKSNKK